MDSEAHNNDQSRICQEYFTAVAQADTSIDMEICRSHLKDRGIQIRKLVQPAVHTLRCLESIKVVNIERGGSVATYRAVLGQFCVDVTLLSIDAKSRFFGRRQISSSKSVKILQLVSQEGVPYVCKRFEFKNELNLLHVSYDGISWGIRGNKQELQDVVREYALNRICEALGVGPKTGSPDHGFDLVCYKNSVEFYLEKGQHIRCTGDIESISERLHYCMRLMHRHKLIHKDIKPENMLYSPSKQDLVLCDFGISEAVDEDENEASLTYREGTASYMSPDMAKLMKGACGMVNLYHNDLYGLRVALNQIKEGQSNKLQQILTGVSQQQQKFPEEQAVSFVYRVHMKWGWQLQGCESRSTLAHLHTYFPQLIEVQQDNIPMNIEFTARILGLGQRLQSMVTLLKQKQKDSKVQQLLRKLSIQLPEDMSSIKLAFTTLSDLKRLERYLTRLLGEAPRDLQSEQSILGVGLSLIEAYYDHNLFVEARAVINNVKKAVKHKSPVLYSWERLMDLVGHIIQPSELESIVESAGSQSQRINFLVRVLKWSPGRSKYHSAALEIANKMVSSSQKYIDNYSLLVAVLGMVDPVSQSSSWNTMLQPIVRELHSSGQYFRYLQLAESYGESLPPICHFHLLNTVLEIKAYLRMPMDLQEISRCQAIAKEFYGLNSYQFLSQGFNTIKYLILAEQYKKAHETVQQLIQKMEVLFGTDTIDMANLYQTLAECDCRLGYATEALKHSNRSQQIAQKFGNNSLIWVTMAYRRVLVMFQYAKLVNTQQAYEDMQHLIDQYTSEFSPNKDDFMQKRLCEIYAAQGLVCLHLQKTPKSTHYFEQVILRFQPNLSNLLFQANALTHLSQLYETAGSLQPIKALILKIQSAYMEEELREAPTISLCVCAAIWVMCGCYEQATKWFQRIDSILAKYPQKCSLLPLDLFLNAANRAITAQQVDVGFRCLSPFKQLPQYPYYWAQLEFKLKRYQQTIQLLKGYLDDVQAQDFTAADSHRILGHCFRKLAIKQESKIHFERALQLFGTTHVIEKNRSGCLGKMGQCLINLGRRRQAYLLCLKATAQCLKVNSSEGLLTIASYLIEQYFKVSNYEGVYRLIRAVRAKIGEQSSVRLAEFECYAGLLARKYKGVCVRLSTLWKASQPIFKKTLQALSLKQDTLKQHQTSLIKWANCFPEKIIEPVLISKAACIGAESIRGLVRNKQARRILLYVKRGIY